MFGGPRWDPPKINEIKIDVKINFVDRQICNPGWSLGLSQGPRMVHHPRLGELPPPKPPAVVWGVAVPQPGGSEGAAAPQKEGKRFWGIDVPKEGAYWRGTTSRPKNTFRNCP